MDSNDDLYNLDSADQLDQYIPTIIVNVYDTPELQEPEVKPSVRKKHDDEINEIAKENCPLRKGKVCFLGHLSSYLNVNKLKNNSKKIEEEPTNFHKGEHKKIKSILKRPSAILSKIPATTISGLLEPKADPSVTIKNNCLEQKSFTVHPSCYEITHKLDSLKKTVSLVPHVHGSNLKISWITTTPADLNTVPVHAIIVRWKFSFTVPCYTIESVYTVLTRYGNITCLVQISPNSALVVYKELDSAKFVASVGIIGYRQCPLLCTWFFKSQFKDRFLQSKLTNTFHRPTAEEAFINHFRQQQKIISTCFRLHAPNMFYDHKTYIP